MYEECNPRPQGLPDLSHLSSHERTFNAGEVIMKQTEIGVWVCLCGGGQASGQG